jgi:glycine/D-amino acid oxidase-like deaminating enzyme
MNTGDPVSFWDRDLGPRSPRPRLAADTEVDICIVGGGLTGLWTAYYLAKADPGLRIAIIERAYAGYGASGRSGGWLSNFIAGSRKKYARKRGRQAVVDLQHAMDASIEECVKVIDAEAIDADLIMPGVLTVARTRAQWDRLQEKVIDDEAWGEHDQVLLGASECSERIEVADALGAAYSPHCARVHPAKLTAGLASVTEASGVRIWEQSPVVRIEPGAVCTPAARVRARHVVVAVEGFTAQMRGRRRDRLPMNSSMIITERVPDSRWDSIGWSGGELLGDMAHMYFYAQRTADGRVAFGGRGKPYRYASRIPASATIPHLTAEALRDLMVDCLPALKGVPVATAWSGVLGVPRDWCSGLTCDAGTGALIVGGYAGHGMTATNLAGRTVRDLVLGLESELISLPWVGHTSPRWEPEPFRWLGVQAVYGAYRRADVREGRSGRGTSVLGRTANLLAGR